MGIVINTKAILVKKIIIYVNIKKELKLMDDGVGNRSCMYRLNEW